MSAPAPVPARRIRAAGHGQQLADTVRLDYDGRFLRRKVLTGEGGLRILVDLDQTVSVDEGDAFELEDGRLVGVVAAPEPLTEVMSDDLPRIAWHIGNRHTPCEIAADRLRIRHDRVMSDMLRRLGARLEDVTAPFRPEGGAYGHGRTHGHSHGEAEGGPHHHPHAHSHHHDHDHPHDHSSDGHGHDR